MKTVYSQFMRLCPVATLLFILTFVICGCSQEDSVAKEITIAQGTSPSTVDPQMAVDEVSSSVLAYSMGGLYKYDADGKLVPCLAESYEVSDDGCTYTFHLKEGLKWSDGRPLSAEDFVFAFKRVADPDMGSNGIYLITDNSMVKNAREVNSGELPVSELGVSAPDNRTFVVELEEPCPYFCSLISKTNFAPCNEDFYHSVGERYASSADTLLYSGPYIMDRYEPLAKQIHFTANPYYVDADTIDVKGVTLQVVANTQQAVMCYEAGDVDIASIGGEYTELAEGDPELSVFSKASVTYIAENSQTCPALQNRNIRMGLSNSIDRDSINGKLLGIGFSSMTRVIPPNFCRETDGSDFAGDSGYYKDYCSYDPAKAREFWEKGLEELGVKEVALRITYASGSGSVAEAMAAQMRAALPGLDLELQPVPFKDLLQRKSAEDYDLMLMGWVADYVDPTSFLGLFIESGDFGYCNPEYDDLYNTLQSTRYALDPEARNELMHKAEDILMEDVAVIPIYTNGSAYLIHTGVEGYTLTPVGDSCVVSRLRKGAE